MASEPFLQYGLAHERRGAKFQAQRLDKRIICTQLRFLKRTFQRRERRRYVLGVADGGHGVRWDRSVLYRAEIPLFTARDPALLCEVHLFPFMTCRHVVIS